MIRKNKKLLILTSLVFLIPMLIGILLWNQLPEQIPFHWDIEGQVDGWCSKILAVFGLPTMLLVLHWICILASFLDPKHMANSGKLIALVLWLCPVISLFCSSIMYAYALGHGQRVNVPVLMSLLMGILFIFVGNYLPKCKQNYTVGIKLPWTLKSKQNWYKTHRFGGKVMFIGGILVMATAFFGNFWILLGILIAMVAVITVYSYAYHLKHKKKAA